MKRYFLLLSLFVLTTCLCAQTSAHDEINLDSIFNDTKGTFVLYDVQTDNYKLHNTKRANEQFSVHSTSKIVWSVIGLEEGLVANATEVMKWDSIKYAPEGFWPKGWGQDQTVVSALKYSVNWYYFELMQLMTPGLIEAYLNKLDFQKGFKVEQLHYFHLTYHIEKSAMEQIAFLQKLYTNQFNLSSSTIDAVKKGMLQEQHNDYLFYYKTGAGEIKNGNCIAWVIGFVEKGDKLYYFAMNMEDASFDAILNKRIRVTKSALMHCSIM